MAKTTLIVLSATTFFLTALNGQQNHVANADEAVNLAVLRNRDFLALNERVKETEALLRQAGVRPFPTIEVEASTGRPLGTVGEEEYSAGYFQPVETGGKRVKRVSVARLVVELARAELQERRRQLTFDVKSRYAETVAAYRKLETIRALLKIDQENLALTTERVRAGDAAAIEAGLFQTELNRTRAQEITFNSRLASGLSELRRAIGSQPGEAPEITCGFSPAPTLAPLAEVQRRANDRPDLRALRITERQFEAEADLARAEGKPDLTASARYAHRDSRFDALGLTPSGSTVPLQDRDNILTFGLSIPVFTGNRNRGNVEAAEARAAATRQRRAFLEGTIPQEVSNAYRRLESARQAIALLNAALDQSEANIRIIREAYNLGQLRAFDVLNEQRRLVEARLSLVDAETESEQALIELERAVGGPIQ